MERAPFCSTEGNLMYVRRWFLKKMSRKKSLENYLNIFITKIIANFIVIKIKMSFNMCTHKWATKVN